MTVRERVSMIQPEITFLALFLLFTLLLVAKGADTRVISAASWTVGIGVVVTLVKLAFGRR